MQRKYLIPVFALVGALLALVVVFWSQRKVPTPPLLFVPPQSPYPHPIAGTGIIEASSQNISIGSPFNEIVTSVYVIAGDRVKKGDPLFQLDTRFFVAQERALKSSWQSAKTLYEDKKTQFSFYQRLKEHRAVSEQAYAQAEYAMHEARDQMQVSLENLQTMKTNIEKSTIRAPIEGEILQVNVRSGESASMNPFVSSSATSSVQSQGTTILMGSVTPLQMRVDINEEDSWRFLVGAPATAFVRGNSKIHFPMKFFRLEPYIVPKTSFTGQTTERVDTRVLQAIYVFEKQDLPIYPGQILDVFIEARPFQSVVPNP